MKKVNQLLPYFLLAGAIVFNLWVLSPELTIKSDPNDNIFQFGLVDRMNQVWQSTNNPLSLIDHWVPNWALGYPLPFYYSHLPHLALVAIYRLLSPPLTIFQLFHLLQYLILALTPLSLYLGARKFGLPKLTAGLVALFSSHLATDGLYGIDPASYTWRGYGLSLQALSVFFLPLALGCLWQAVKEGKKYLGAILFLSACLASHLATGYICLLSCALIPLAFIKIPVRRWHVIVRKLFAHYCRLLLTLTGVFLLLAYWLVPLIFNNQYHAVSLWDPPSKWFSYGFKEVVNLFLNGDLLDYQRWPLLTALTLIGFFVASSRAQKPKYRFFALLFPVWFVLFFGKPTLGGLIKLLPLASEYHLHRFIIGVHLSALFLMGIGANRLVKRRSSIGTIILIILLALPVYQGTNKYLGPNKQWIRESNARFDRDWVDFEKIIQEITRQPPGRIYAGRPGNWGKDFKVGPTPVYMALSVRGLATSGFLPETWSLNSDPEQFFNEQWPQHYNLFNIRYLVTPLDHQIPDFAQEIGSFGNYRLSQVETSGYFDLGYSNLAVLAQKENILNIIHLWMISNSVKQKQFPTLVLKGSSGLTNQIKMIDEVNYEVLGQKYNLFANPVFTQAQAFKINPKGKVLQEKVEFQKYEAMIEIDKDCQSCLVVFKMTYHPNWQTKIDHQPAEKLMVFPSLMAARIPPGMHHVSFEYQPSSIKLLLLASGALALIAFSLFQKQLRRQIRF